MTRRLSKVALDAFAEGMGPGTPGALRAMATELLELRAFRDAVLAYMFGPSSDWEAFNNVLLAAERARMEGNP